MNDGKGETVASKIIEVLHDWSVDTNNITCCCFDTTAANTGHNDGAIVHLQSYFGKPLLWIACRHHIAEVILSHVFNKLEIENSTGPEISIFTRFRQVFPLLSRTPELLNCIYSNAPQIVTREINLLTSLKSLLTKKFVRDDYREFLELAIIFLERGDTYSSEYIFKCCGAIHKARWMAKAIYAMKMVLYKDELEKREIDFFEEGQYEKLVRFVMFILHFYVQYWIECPLSAKAPQNDLQLYKNLTHYRMVDEEVADAAIHGLKLQSWYLSEELVGLSLFDETLPVEVKSAVAESMLQFVPMSNRLPNRHGRAFGKPCSPEDISFTTQLCDLVGPNSSFFFKALNLSPDFLGEPSSDWPYIPCYMEGVAKIKSLNVINDAAERSVKMSSDFLSAAKIETRYQATLQVVENNRMELPNLRAKKQTVSNWCSPSK